jgi:hypothetical protein
MFAVTLQIVGITLHILLAVFPRTPHFLFATFSALVVLCHTYSRIQYAFILNGVPYC